jgi:hypothetical protein
MKKTSSTSGCSKELAAQRSKMVSDGYYDGRFRSKTFTDRKKEAARKACRNNTQK